MARSSLKRVFAALALVLGTGLALQAQDGDEKAAPRPRAAKPAPKRKAKPRIPDSRRTDVNTASKAKLMQLPGVDAACADRIIRGRHYFSKIDLVLNGAMDRAIYLRIKDKIFASQDLKKFPPPVAKAPAKK